MSTLLIRNARLVNEGNIFDADLLVRHGRIDKIATSIAASADEEIDAAGQWLLPGMIDDQVHFREPGLTHKGCIATESAAAVAGGITSFMDMPNTRPPTQSMAAMAEKKAVAARDSLANYGFHFGVSNNNLDAVAALDPREVAGIKMFMGASTGNMLVDDPAVLERLFAYAPTILITHCEDTPSILANEEKWRQSHGEAIPFSAHPLIRDAEACYKSSSLAVARAKKHGTRLHVLHISTARELELFEDKPLADKRITAEVLLAGQLGFFALERPALWRHAHAHCNAAAGKQQAEVIAPLILIGDAFHNFVGGRLIASTSFIYIALADLLPLLHRQRSSFALQSVLIGWVSWLYRR